jgi:hypothetical protein
MAVSCPAWRWAFARPPGGTARRWAHSARAPADSAEMPSNWVSPCRVVLAAPVGITITDPIWHPLLSGKTDRPRRCPASEMYITEARHCQDHLATTDDLRAPVPVPSHPLPLILWLGPRRLQVDGLAGLKTCKCHSQRR